MEWFICWKWIATEATKNQHLEISWGGQSKVKMFHKMSCQFRSWGMVSLDSTHHFLRPGTMVKWWASQLLRPGRLRKWLAWWFVFCVDFCWGVGDINRYMKLAFMYQYGWCFQIWFIFHPYLGKWSHLTIIFQMSWNHQLDRHGWFIM